MNISDALRTGEHIVQFYEDDDFLVEEVSEFIDDGLSRGEAAIIIASDAHLHALKAALKKKRGDENLRALTARKSFILLNANETLSQFMDDGWPDEQRFNATIEPVLAQARAGTNAPVRAFGEMVAILCAQGKSEAAIRLEELWNKLAKRHFFSLFCGYPMSAFSREESSPAFHAICTLHSRVCPAEHHENAYRNGDDARILAHLQQKTRALECEVESRKKTEQALNERERILIERTAALSQANALLQSEIEKRKKSEQELLHVQRTLTIAQKVAHLGSWEIDGASDTLQCSEEFFRICGLQPQSGKLSIESALNIVHPDDRQAVRDGIMAAKDKKQAYGIKKRIIRPDGSIRHVLSQGHTFLNESTKLVSIIGSFLDITERTQAEAALRKSTEDLRHLAAYQEQLKEEERKRIAREVHDELGGLLTCLKAYITVSIERSAKAGRPVDKLLLDASNLADDAIESVRKIITDLRPSVLDELGVWAAIEWYADQLMERTGITCQCTIGRTASVLKLDTERSTMLFRIVQEALTNVVRHAQASVITIGITRMEKYINLEIEDDGKGMDTEFLLQGNSWGIHGMYERARHFGGELKIAGVAGQGTMVRLKLPLSMEMLDVQ